MKSEQNKILDLVINSDKHKKADRLNEQTKSMVIDAIAIALVMNGKKSIDDFDVELKDNEISIMEKSFFEGRTIDIRYKRNTDTNE